MALSGREKSGACHRVIGYRPESSLASSGATQPFRAANGLLRCHRVIFCLPRHRQRLFDTYRQKQLLSRRASLECQAELPAKLSLYPKTILHPSLDVSIVGLGTISAF